MEIDIKIYPDNFLLKKCEDIDFEKDNWKEIAASLIVSIYKYKAVGMAAPQIGILKNIFVTDHIWKGNKKNIYKNLNVFINPKIINTSIEDVLSTEGCISIPTVGGVIYRQKEITIEYFDEHTNKVQKTFSNMLSKIIQHEMDHLNGILFINKMPENQRSLIASKLFSLRRHQKD